MNSESNKCMYNYIPHARTTYLYVSNIRCMKFKQGVVSSFAFEYLFAIKKSALKAIIQFLKDLKSIGHKMANVTLKGSMNNFIKIHKVISYIVFI